MADEIRSIQLHHYPATRREPRLMSEVPYWILPLNGLTAFGTQAMKHLRDKSCSDIIRNVYHFILYEVFGQICGRCRGQLPGAGHEQIIVVALETCSRPAALAMATCLD